MVRDKRTACFAEIWQLVCHEISACPLMHALQFETTGLPMCDWIFKRPINHPALQNAEYAALWSLLQLLLIRDIETSGMHRNWEYQMGIRYNALAVLHYESHVVWCTVFWELYMWMNACCVCIYVRDEVRLALDYKGMSSAKWSCWDIHQRAYWSCLLTALTSH